jgi:hypothetical protein
MSGQTKTILREFSPIPVVRENYKKITLSEPAWPWNPKIDAQIFEFIVNSLVQLK